MIPSSGSCTAVINVALLLFVIVLGATKIDTANYTIVNDSYWPYGFGKVFSAAGTIFFSYLGFDMVSSMAEEVTKPQRDLPIGIFGSLAIAGKQHGRGAMARSKAPCATAVRGCILRQINPG